MDRDILELLIRNLSHEIKNPLTTIKGYLQLSQMKQNDPQFFSKSVGVMISQVDRIEKILDALYPAFSIREGEREKVSVKTIIEKIIGMKPELSASRITVDIKGDDTILIDPHLFQRLLCTIVKKFDWDSFPDVLCRITKKQEEQGFFLNIEFSGTEFQKSKGNATFMPYANKTFYPSGVDLYEAFWITQVLGLTITNGDHTGIFILGLQ
jgi:two-component system, sporulation sensor kinase E